MEPIHFKQVNVEIAKNQKEYKTLPAFVTRDGVVISCWQMNFKERIKALFTGKVFLTLLTFNKPLQPQLLQIDSPFEDLE